LGAGGPESGSARERFDGGEVAADADGGVSAALADDGFLDEPDDPLPAYS